MSGDPGSQPVSVHGGTAGIWAGCDEIDAMARRMGEAASESLSAAVSLHRYLVDPNVMASAALDPVGYAAFEADLLTALDGPHGLAAAGARCAALDVELRAAALAYRAVDELDQGLGDAVGGLAGLPGALREGFHSGHGLGGIAQSIVAHDPAVADTLMDGLLLAPVAVTAAKLADGRGVVVGGGIDHTAGRPPRRLTDIAAELEHRNEDPRHGAIDVRILTAADGSRRAIVDVTGTKSWALGQTSDITSLRTNARALVGLPTSYEQGVLDAMQRAGVRATDPVMLVGHSEGGMVAVTAARDAVRSGRFNITHVLAMGSPIGLTAGEVPKRVNVLAVEGRSDVVPHLDGHANPDRRNVTTAVGQRGDWTIGGDHDLGRVYLPLVGDVQASRDRSVADYLRSADGFLRAKAVVTHSYQIQRE